MDVIVDSLVEILLLGGWLVVSVVSVGCFLFLAMVMMMIESID